jgi:hypothetical protein
MDGVLRVAWANSPRLPDGTPKQMRPVHQDIGEMNSIDKLAESDAPLAMPSTSSQDVKTTRASHGQHDLLALQHMMRECYVLLDHRPVAAYLSWQQEKDGKKRRAKQSYGDFSSREKEVAVKLDDSAKQRAAELCKNVQANDIRTKPAKIARLDNVVRQVSKTVVTINSAKQTRPSIVVNGAQPPAPAACDRLTAIVARTSRSSDSSSMSALFGPQFGKEAVKVNTIAKIPKIQSSKLVQPLPPFSTGTVLDILLKDEKETTTTLKWGPSDHRMSVMNKAKVSEYCDVCSTGFL